MTDHVTNFKTDTFCSILIALFQLEADKKRCYIIRKCVKMNQFNVVYQQYIHVVMYDYIS